MLGRGFAALFAKPRFRAAYRAPAKARYARKAKELYGRKSGARNSGRESEKSAFKNHFSAFSKFIETLAKIAEKDGLFSF